MRTTINIEDDVLDQARKVAAKLQQPFRRVVNEALRAGLQTVENDKQSKPYKTKPVKMGLKPGLCIDNIQELLAQVEGEDFN